MGETLRHMGPEANPVDGRCSVLRQLHHVRGLKQHGHAHRESYSPGRIRRRFDFPYQHCHFGFV